MNSPHAMNVTLTITQCYWKRNSRINRRLPPQRGRVCADLSSRSRSGDHSDDITVLAPGLCTAMCGNPEYDWDFKTTPQLTANSEAFGHIRCKQLNESSAMNFVFWTQASRGDIDNWANWKSRDSLGRNTIRSLRNPRLTVSQTLQSYRI